MFRPEAGPRRLVRPRAREYASFAVEPLAVTLGGLVTGLDLRRPLSDAAFAELDHAWREFKVLLFRDQPLTASQHAALAARFGTLTDDQLAPTPEKNPIDCLVEFTRDAGTPGLENGWHTDGTFRVQPTAGTILRAIAVPPIGGDTLFADMAAAYDDLPESLRERIDPLVAVHDWSLGAYANKSLCQNPCLLKRDERRGEVEHGFVVRGLLLPTHQDATESIEPRVAPLDDPPPSAEARVRLPLAFLFPT